eukprot:TRINITY_DN9072_c0_g2_i1.p1 TRINITY_DN9072_c0_g2~~TRINITY_DN9072_c0_g2_i1.p1  ORF type:complete len:275 (+),score=88.35 TRINITY_DN9072_c0_g2_i1:115-825(+)
MGLEVVDEAIDLLDKCGSALRKAADAVRAKEERVQKERDELAERLKDLEAREAAQKKRDESRGAAKPSQRISKRSRSPPSRQSRSRSSRGRKRSRSRSHSRRRSRSHRNGVPSAKDRVKIFIREHRVTPEVERKMLDIPADPTAVLCDLVDAEARRDRREVSMRGLQEMVDRLHYLDRCRDAIAEATRALKLRSSTADQVKRIPFTFAVAFLAKVDPINTRDGDREVEDLVRAMRR